MNSHTTNAYLLPVYERGRMVEKAGKCWFLGNDWEYNEMRERCKYL